MAHCCADAPGRDPPVFQALRPRLYTVFKFWMGIRVLRAIATLLNFRPG